MCVRTHTQTHTHTLRTGAPQSCPCVVADGKRASYSCMLLLGYLASFTGPSLRCLSSMWP